MRRGRSLPNLEQSPRWRGRSVEEHAEALVAVCRAATKVLQSRPDASRVLADAERVPQSTRAILRRLARRHG